MSTKNEVSSRFIAAFEYLLKVNAIADKKDFALKLGISPSMVTEISKGRSAVGTTAIQNIVIFFNISGDWLLTGEGEMLKTSTPSPDGASPKVAKSEKISSTPEDTTAFLSYMREQSTAHTKAIEKKETELKERDTIIRQQSQEITDLRCEVTRLEGENHHLTTENQRLQQQADRMEAELQQYRSAPIPAPAASAPASTASTQAPTASTPVSTASAPVPTASAPVPTASDPVLAKEPLSNVG